MAHFPSVESFVHHSFYINSQAGSSETHDVTRQKQTLFSATVTVLQIRTSHKYNATKYNCNHWEKALATTVEPPNNNKDTSL